MIGLQPRELTWILPRRLAIGERPGGYGRNHRRIRREEEIGWLSRQGFTAIVSFLPSTQNMAAYRDAGLRAWHLPLQAGEVAERLPEAFALLDTLVREDGAKVFAHVDDVDDTLTGICGAYLLYLRVVPNPPSAVASIEAVTQRPLGPPGRSLVQATAVLLDAGFPPDTNSGG